MLSEQAHAELERKLGQAREIMAAIMAADESGSVTIGYGSGGLRIEHSRHEKPVPVKVKPTAAAAKDGPLLIRSGGKG